MVLDSGEEPSESETRDSYIEKHILLGVALSIAAIATVGWAMWPVITAALAENNPAVTWLGLMSVTVLAGFAGLAVMLPVVKRQEALRDYEFRGYHVRWSLTPRTWLGRHTYEVRRTDDLGYGGMIVGSPSAMRRDERLKERAASQREMDCNVCGKCVGGDSAFNPGNEAYFVEHREAFYLFGVPLRRKLTEVEAYCDEHQPRGWGTN